MVAKSLHTRLKLHHSGFFSVFALAVATWMPAGTASAQVDSNRFVGQFESTFAKHGGCRRSGAKGVCAVGELVGSAQGRALSTSSASSGKPVGVIVRFSVGGANPNAPDNTRGQRNLALPFNPPKGEVWQMGNSSAPVFGAATPEQFLGRPQSLQPDPVTKAADPARVKAFAVANPEVLLQGRCFAGQPVPASFGGVIDRDVHAFGFVNAQGNTQSGKWVFEPVSGTQSITDEQAKSMGPAFVFSEPRQRVPQGSVALDFNLPLAQPGDRLDSVATPLTDDRRKVTLRHLTITSLAADNKGDCVGTTFNPIVLPKGVVASTDPMLAACAAPCAVGLGRRLTEGSRQQGLYPTAPEAGTFTTACRSALVDTVARPYRSGSGNGRKARTCSAIRAGSIGFSRWATQPASSERSRSRAMAWALSATTGIAASAGTAMRRRVA